MAQPNDRAREGDETTAGSDSDLESEPESEPTGRTDSGSAQPTGGQSGHRTDPDPADSGPDRDPRDEPVQVADEERRRNTAIVSGIVAVIGVWLAVSVVLYDAEGAVAWNNLLVGAVVFLAAGYNFYRQYNDVPLSIGLASLVAVLGIWTIVAAALFETTGGFFWSTVASGLLVTALAGYNAYEAREAQTVATESDATS